MLLLECPRCGNRMKYNPLKKSAAAAAVTTAVALTDLSKKVKKCVYCNFSMNVQKSVAQGF